MANLFKRILLAALAAGVVLAAGGNPAPSQAQTDNKIRLGFIPVIYAPIYVAQERGYFAEEGVEVELLPVPAGAGDSIVQLAAGNFDMAVTGAGAPLFNAAYQGLGFKVVAPLHTERAPMSTPLVISAKRTDEIKQVSDLFGKKIAINNTGSAVEYWVYTALGKNGLNMADITIVTMPFPQMAEALENGAIDAAVITEPLMTLALDQGLIAVLADDFIDGITVTYAFAGLPLLEERPQLAEAFVRAYLRGARDLQSSSAWQDDEIAAIIEKWTKVPAAVIKRINRPYFDPNGTIPLDDLAEVQRYFLSTGVLEYSTALDIADYVDSSYVEKALEVLGVVEDTSMTATAEPTMAATQSK
jgi:NitT/TauT family transport system substrate-binding protein